MTNKSGFHQIERKEFAIRSQQEPRRQRAVPSDAAKRAEIRRRREEIEDGINFDKEWEL